MNELKHNASYEARWKLSKTLFTKALETQRLASTVARQDQFIGILQKLNLILKFHNNLTRAKSPVRLPMAKPDSLRFSYALLTLINVSSA
ncbi:hypothetical protein [Leptospira kirschneri]|uniref:hypothetical protein n=1 Tax=Leptospira kirschneri TaxID=29507 RepID=UPI0009E26126|nr:hypothetical protein [Leptospira kirschneri]